MPMIDSQRVVSEELLLNINRKSHISYRTLPFQMSLNDLCKVCTLISLLYVRQIHTLQNVLTNN